MGMQAPLAFEPDERRLATLMGRPCGKEVAQELHAAGSMAKRANNPAETSSSATSTQAQGM